MSGLPMSRALALRASLDRVAREKRKAEAPQDAGSLAGQYRGPHRRFSLVWVEAEHGYRREFDNDSAWRWEDPTVFSATQVQALFVAGAWCGSGSAHHVTASESPERNARRTPHQNSGFCSAGGDPESEI